MAARSAWSRFVASVEPRTARRPGRSAAPALDIPFPLSAAGLVGREAEMAQVQACLERARRGQRQVPFITGTADIGKTTLVDACVTALPAQETVWIGWGQCVDHYGPGTEGLPVLEALGRLCRGPAGSPVLAQLRQWAPTWLAQLSGVLPAAEQARLWRRTQGTTRERMLRGLAETLEALTTPAGKGTGAPGRHESEPAMAAARQTGCSACTPRTDLRLVHGGL